MKGTTAAGERIRLRLPARVRTAGEKPRRRLTAAAWKPYLFMLPAVALIGFWVYKPLVQTVGLSFYKWSMVPGTTPAFVGLQNFAKLFANKDFWPAMGNTLFYTLGLLPFSILIPLFIAVATQNVGERAKKVYRALFFIPMIMAPVAVSTIFQWLLHPTNGLVNQLLISWGVIDQGIAFFADERFSRTVILLITGWKMMGFSTLMFSSALAGVNTEYYESARLDGAGPLRQFKDITVPLLSPTILLMVMMSVLFASQWTFAYIDILSQGGPYGSSTNIYYMMYRFGFNDMNVGLSTAAALLFFAVFGLIALGFLKLNKKYAFYDN